MWYKLCSQNHNLSRRTECLKNSVYDHYCSARRFNLCPNCLTTDKKELCQPKQGALWTDAMAFNTLSSSSHNLCSVDPRQKQQNAQPNVNWNQMSQNNKVRNRTNQGQSKYGRNLNNETQRELSTADEFELHHT